ncbi:MAG TPA: heavy metal translocating P-type ATPase [Rubrivivax sp.]
MTSAVAEPSAGAALIDDPAETLRFTTWQATDSHDAGGRIGLSSFQLSGLHCGACAGIIESAVGTVAGVLGVDVNAAAHRATVRWDPRLTRPSALIASIQRAGYGAAPDCAVSARDARRLEHRNAVWRLFIAAFLAMQVMMLATPSYVAGPGELAPDLRQLLNWGSWLLSLPVLCFAGMPFLRGAWQALRQRRIAMDVPVALGIVVAFVASTGATFDPDGAFGHEVYFDSLTMFIAFLWLGRFIEQRQRHRAAEALEAALGELPAAAWRVGIDDSVEEISVQRLRVGDRVRVPSGGAIPADGVLLSAAAAVGEALLTGESQAQAKRAGDTLLASSLNRAAPFEMRVERVGADTRQAAIVHLMRQALAERPAAARVADRWAGPFLWTVLLLAAAAAAAWSVIDPARAVWVAVSVLIVTCPCALSLATPATLVAAASGLARRGVILRRLGALEALAQVRHVYMDKTGTLSEDDLQSASLHIDLDPASPFSADAALAWAGSLAGWSSHPLSRALASRANTAGGLAPPTVWSAVEEVPGAGLRARDAEGCEWRLGSAAWVGEGADADPSAVWIGRGGRRLAAFTLAETPRPDAAEAVAALRAGGLQLTLLSGDGAARAQALALRVGIDQVIAPASPEQKLQTVRAAQAAGATVAMVGDGLNDAPVMAAANVSIAIGHAALAAREGADAVIVSGRTLGVVDTRATALRAMRIVKQNLAWAAAYNGACIPLAMAGLLPPWAAGLGMAASSVFVVLNAQRAGKTTA